jgi:AraC-like DNA-binding protein
VTSIEFDAALLSCGRQENPPATSDANVRVEPKVPGQEDTLATISSVTDLALYDGYPRMDWVAAKLGMTRRSLQRLLGAHRTTFNCMVGGALLRRAKVLLDDGTVPITEIALELGYRDPAHFTRAFRRWTGVSPTTYRNIAT